MKHENFEKEHYELLLKSARRCAYDLKHSAATQQSPEFMQIYMQRAEMWIGIFSPDGIKNYRHELHQEIDRLRSLLRMNGIEE